RDFLHSDVGVTYFNQGNRFNYGLQAYQQSSAFSAFASFNSIGFLRNTYRGFNAVAAYPFSKFARVELFSGVTWVEQDLLVDSFDGREFDRETNDIGTFNYVQAGAALVFDNTVYGPLGPNSGSRSRFSVTATANDFQFTNFFADHRRYFNISPRTVLAWRLLGGASIGKDEQIFRLGGAYSYRGADFGELIGPNFFVSNLEYRFPFLPFLPANYDFLSAAAFWDVGAAWGIDVPGFVSEEFQPFTSDNGFRLKDLQSAFGIGARLNIGYFLLQYDLAFPTDLQGFNKPVNLFSIGTYF
ncbi:hypothetical protein GWO09_32085, partial [candidate division KSB1 bacterium]|nr:hypothetical protein [candidate division KSB1 bacterium]